MNFLDSTSLFLIMIALAAIPSSSVALVVTRSAMMGIPNGVAVSVGIVLGDLVFIMLAILGLSAVAETLGGFFAIVRYLGGGYLLWIGYSLLSANNKPTYAVPETKMNGNLLVSLFSGFFLTLGDVKAIFFYASLFPTFLELTAVSTVDLLTIFLITIVAVGGVKVAYAVAATRLAGMTRDMKHQEGARKLAGSLVVGAGGFLIWKA
jgi:threonine/homoserine/homoserine lactone efflux protein